MAYISTIPLATDQLSQSQSEIQENFNQINLFVNTDHVAFNVANQGKHNSVRMPVLGAPPAFTAGEMALWNEALAESTQNELHVRKSNQAGDVSIPMTASVLGRSVTPIGTTGWTFLPSGILMKWGSAGGITGSGNLVAVNDGGGGVLGPDFAEVFTVQVTGESAPLDAVLHANIPVLPNINIDSNDAGPISVFWFVIGR